MPSLPAIELRRFRNAVGHMFFTECIKERFDAIGYGEHLRNAIVEKRSTLKLVTQRKNTVVVPINIEKSDRTCVQTELTPREGFKEFVECTETARQCNNQIRQFDHSLLALMHGFDFMQHCAAIECNLGCVQERRDNPCDMSTTFEYRARHDPHEAYAAPSIHEIPPSIYNGVSDAFSCCLE